MHEPPSECTVPAAVQPEIVATALVETAPAKPPTFPRPPVKPSALQPDISRPPLLT